MVVKWNSRTTWTGVAMIGYGLGNIVSGNASEGIQEVLNGLAIIFLRSAIKNETNGNGK
jgi:hypothetical protein